MRSASSKSTSPRPDDSRAAATHTGLTAVAVQRRGKPDEELVKQPMLAQRVALDEEPVKQTMQRVALDEEPVKQTMPAQRVAEPNRTGMPDSLKSGVESLSGHSLSDVRVHYNSSEPAQLQALAYAQGNDIHLGPGQEKHLPHEAWHVVQQRQGRVQATTQLMKGVPLNDDPSLESEATEMGNKAATMS